MRLTDDQRRAAGSAGSVAVTAGAGTGKTRMLAHRFLHHVTEHGLSPLSIVAVTFTDKAADELRSRIRRAIVDEIRNDRIAAEVEAAQISTIHALAARICRDFYDLAGVPADFAILDEVRSPTWFSEKLEEAIAFLNPDVVSRFGYSWAKRSLEQLLADPFASDEAFGRSVDDWREEIDAISGPALEAFLASDAWAVAAKTVNSISGDEGDRLETARRQAAAAIEQIERREGVADALTVLANLSAGQGKASAWPPGGKALMAACLKDLKETTATYLPTAGLQIGEADLQVAEMLGDLRVLYVQVRDFLRAAKLKERLLDFTDLEHYALEILKHEEAVEYYAARWKAFLIDEFQDTNPVQGELIDRLTSRAKLTVVGDEKQSIYGFRRADVEVFARFRGSIKAAGGEEVQLSTTFRAHTALVAEMNNVFDVMLGDMHQPLGSERHPPEHQPFVTFHAVEKADAVKRERQFVEAMHIAGRIKQMLDSGTLVHDGAGGTRPVEPRDIAILTRTWEPLEIYNDALAACGIPAVHAGGGSLLGTREFKDAFALLSFLADPDDDISLVAVLRSPFFAYSDKVLYRFAAAMPANTPWWAVVRNEPGELEAAANILSHLMDRRGKVSAADLLAAADRLTGYRSIIENLPHGARRAADWRGTLAYLRSMGSEGRADVFGAVRMLRQLIEADVELPRPPLDAGQAVSLMTIHKAKGLEWPIVFVADLARERPSAHDHLLIDAATGIAFRLDDGAGGKIEPAIYKLIKQKRQEREEAEARRVLYVAMTRAGDQVHLTATDEASGPFVKLLLPGLAAAGIPVQIIPFDAAAARPAVPMPPAVPDLPEIEIPEPVRFGPDSVPATALSVYAECPLKFKFIYMDGHPGVGEGPAIAANVGTLAHKALELDLTLLDELRPFADPGMSDERISEALDLAERFRSSPVFSTVRAVPHEREKRFSLEMNGLRVTGAVDVVGPDFVLDYKTDSAVDPLHHRFQLWAYARAFRKEKAYIAYLRPGVMHEFSGPDLNELDETAAPMFKRILDGEMPATPSHASCGRCNYSQVCDSRNSE